MIIHSFIQDISIAPLQAHYHSKALPHSTDTVSQCHVEAPPATESEGLAQGPYVAGFEPATLPTKGAESTNEKKKKKKKKKMMMMMMMMTTTMMMMTMTTETTICCNLTKFSYCYSSTS